MTPYDVFLRREVMDFLRSIAKQPREQLLGLMERLGANPTIQGDYAELDSTGRRIEVLVHHKFAVLYWSDHAAKEVKICEIRYADK